MHDNPDMKELLGCISHFILISTIETYMALWEKFPTSLSQQDHIKLQNFYSTLGEKPRQNNIFYGAYLHAISLGNIKTSKMPDQFNKELNTLMYNLHNNVNNYLFWNTLGLAADEATVMPQINLHMIPLQNPTLKRFSAYCYGKALSIEPRCWISWFNLAPHFNNNFLTTYADLPETLKNHFQTITNPSAEKLSAYCLGETLRYNPEFHPAWQAFEKFLGKTYSSYDDIPPQHKPLFHNLTQEGKKLTIRALATFCRQNANPSHKKTNKRHSAPPTTPPPEKKLNTGISNFSSAQTSLSTISTSSISMPFSNNYSQNTSQAFFPRPGNLPSPQTLQLRTPQPLQLQPYPPQHLQPPSTSQSSIEITGVKESSQSALDSLATVVQIKTEPHTNTSHAYSPTPY